MTVKILVYLVYIFLDTRCFQYNKGRSFGWKANILKYYITYQAPETRYMGLLIRKAFMMKFSDMEQQTKLNRIAMK